MSKQRVVNLSEVRTQCQKCSLYQLCMPMGLAEGDLNKLDKIIKRRRPVEKGEFLFHLGEEFTALYAIRSGSLKTCTSQSDGQEQVIGMHLPGELIGLDAIGDSRHGCSAVALETTSVCEIPFEHLEALSREIPGLQHHLFRLMSAEIQHDQCHMTVLARMPVENRLASFLLSLSDRYKLRGYSASEFNLSMSRSDIANMLGMAMETISRLLTGFQEQGLIRVERKHIRILDAAGLRAIAGQCGELPDSPVDNSSSHSA